MKGKGMFKGIKILLLTQLFLLSCSKTGTSFSLPEQQSTFTGQVYLNNKVDILFVVDNSSSMLQYQKNLASQMNAFIATLNSLKMDYRIAVTTTTMSTNATNYPMTRSFIGSPYYLTSANISQLATRVVVGEAGSDLERGLDSMKYVTSGSYETSHPFIRSDALLSVIFISDEVDQSSEYGDPNSNDFVNYLNTKKPNFDDGSKGWVANYIGILTNKSCDVLGSYVSIGTQFIKLVDASNGVKSSICNADLSAAVSGIKARIIDQLTTYRFSTQPDKSTIQVIVGGTVILEDSVNGWTLETEVVSNVTTYLLKFHGTSVPAADEAVYVNFKPISAY